MLILLVAIKMMIHDKVKGPIDKLNVLEFKKMFMEIKCIQL